MKFLILLYISLILVGTYFWNHLPRYQEPVPPVGTNSQLWKRGRIMYQARCIACHNSNPDLPGSVGPRLRGVSQELLRDRLTNGKGGMPAQPNMLRFVPALREYLK